MSTIKRTLSPAEINEALGFYVLGTTQHDFPKNTILRQQVIALGDGHYRVEIGPRGEMFDDANGTIPDGPFTQRLKDSGADFL